MISAIYSPVLAILSFAAGALVCGLIHSARRRRAYRRRLQARLDAIANMAPLPPRKLYQQD